MTTAILNADLTGRHGQLKSQGMLITVIAEKIAGRYFCRRTLLNHLPMKIINACTFLFSLALLPAVICRAQEKGMSISNSGKPFFSLEQKQQMAQAGAAPGGAEAVAPVSFRYAASKVMRGVVWVLTNYRPGFQPPANTSLEYYHKLRSGANKPASSVCGSASGVLLTDDGYLVTNYHAVKDAVSVEIVLNDRRSYIAQVIGGDSLTDLALLKIAARQLPFVIFGSTDSIDTGDWVLAAGNPLNLTSTVTAGIVSAKSRSVDLLEEQGGSFSFIQTDAVMNSGNSGGALVDIYGRLIGINTGILTQTGAYSGYSFAIPVEVVKKVCNDILRYGQLRRGFIGLYLKEIGSGNGLYVDSLVKAGTGERSGIRSQDIVVAVNDKPMLTMAAFNEMLILHRPGEKVNVTVLRDGKQLQLPVVLNAQEEIISFISGR